MHVQSFGLPERNVNTLVAILEKYSDVTEVFIFGSRAKGNYKPGSDIDLAIMNTGLHDKTLNQILSDFSESNIPFQLDLVDIHQIKTPELMEHIQRVGLPFYQRK